MDGHPSHGLIANRVVTNEDGSVRPVEITDLRLVVKKPKGTVVERDVSCDSTFMLENIREIGSAVCSKYHYLDDFVSIYLFMDNSGGHGTKAVKQQYTEILKEEFNLIVEWQPPNSPEMNLLDLGIWMAL